MTRDEWSGDPYINAKGGLLIERPEPQYGSWYAGKREPQCTCTRDVFLLCDVKFITAMTESAELTIECVISSIYLARYMSMSGAQVTRSNWRPLLSTSLLLASKVWDDVSMVNSDFA